MEARPDAGDRVAVVDGDGHAASRPTRKRLLQCRAARWASQASPASPHSRSSASRSRARSLDGRRELGLLDLDVVEADDRVDLDRVRVGLLAHDLAVDLALGWHVDDDVAGDAAPCSRAAGPARGPRSAAYACSTALDRREVRGRRGDAVLGVLAFADLDLAAAADAAAAADGVEIDTEPARGVEHRRARRRTGRAGPRA